MPSSPRSSSLPTNGDTIVAQEIIFVLTCGFFCMATVSHIVAI
jgi:hypothetical protein